MEKTGTPRDLNRRYKYVSKLQDEVIRKRPKGQAVRDWEKELPRADDRWPTALIIVPSSLIGNWERELETVSMIILAAKWGQWRRHFIIVGLLRSWNLRLEHQSRDAGKRAEGLQAWTFRHSCASNRYIIETMLMFAASKSLDDA